MDWATLQREFHDKGYVVIDSQIEESVIDGIVRDLDGYFGHEAARPIHVPFADYNRIQDAWHISQNVLHLARSEVIADTISALYGKPAEPFQTLNFYRGTGQRVHSDSIHFNSEPFGAMCGAWTALEDIGPDQGPLIYYPGSQELPEMNYDYFDLRPSYDSYPAYLDHLDRIINERGYQPELGLLRKGQTLIWCANILHGGSPQKDKTLTRKSQVTHYFVGAPKTWRPSESEHKRFYFEPEVIRDMSGEPYKYPIQPSLPTFAQRVRAAISHRLRR